MKPDEESITYAKEQIREAKRRLEGIESRVGSEYLYYEKRDDMGDGRISSAEFHPPKEFAEENLGDFLDGSEEEYEKRIQTRIDDDLLKSHIQNVVIDCQLCIELAVKAMFKLSGKDHPFSHGISFDDGRTQGFYNEISEDFGRSEDVVRVIFLTKFWGGNSMS